jgi:hypothetical protein
MTIPENAKPGTIVYRANAHYIDFYNQPRKVSVSYAEYEVTKVTPKGAWVAEKGNLRMSEFSKMFIDEDLRQKPDVTWYPFTRRFVSTTKEEALEGLRLRKIRHRMHIRRRLKGVEDILRELGVDFDDPVRTRLELDNA